LKKRESIGKIWIFYKSEDQLRIEALMRANDIQYVVRDVKRADVHLVVFTLVSMTQHGVFLLDEKRKNVHSVFSNDFIERRTTAIEHIFITHKGIMVAITDFSEKGNLKYRLFLGDTSKNEGEIEKNGLFQEVTIKEMIKGEPVSSSPSFYDTQKLSLQNSETWSSRHGKCCAGKKVK